MSAKVIPELWLSVPLEEVILRIVGGGTPSKSKPEYYQGNIPWMSVKDMNKYVLLDTIDHISLEAVESSSTNVIPAGTPIIATRMSLGKIVVANFDSAINQDLKALFLPAGIHRDYLVYWYRSVARSIEQMGTGTTVKGIRLEVLKRLEFALPPLDEQKVIADKLDTLLAQVDSTKARLERIPEILKRFRQSMLAAAVSGRLTEEWQEESHHASWAVVKLDEISNSISDGDHQAPPKAQDGIPFLVISNITGGGIDFGNISRWVPQGYYNNLKCIRKPSRNDLLYTVTGSFGIPVIVNTDQSFCFQRHIAIIKPNHNLVSTCYLAFYLQSPKAYAHAESVATGTAQKTVSLTNLRTFPISLPTLEEQTEIVRRVDQLFAYADTVERQVNSALDRINQLTQSILTKAFHGELTTQWRKDNLDLISGENSAEALLAKIKIERETIKKQPKPKQTLGKKRTVSSMSKQIIKVTEALEQAGTPLSGQQLLAAAGYPSDSNIQELEQFFLDIREALSRDKYIVKLERSDDGQDWFALAEAATNE